MIRLPAPPKGIDPAMAAWANALLHALNTYLTQLEVQAGTGWNITTPVTPRRTLDATTGTATEVREALATLITDLKNRSRLG